MAKGCFTILFEGEHRVGRVLKGILELNAKKTVKARGLKLELLKKETIPYNFKESGSTELGYSYQLVTKDYKKIISSLDLLKDRRNPLIEISDRGYVLPSSTYRFKFEIPLYESLR